VKKKWRSVGANNFWKSGPSTLATGSLVCARVSLFTAAVSETRRPIFVRPEPSASAVITGALLENANKGVRQLIYASRWSFLYISSIPVAATPFVVSDGPIANYA